MKDNDKIERDVVLEWETIYRRFYYDSIFNEYQEENLKMNEVTISKADELVSQLDKCENLLRNYINIHKDQLNNLTIIEIKRLRSSIQNTRSASFELEDMIEKLME